MRRPTLCGSTRNFNRFQEVHTFLTCVRVTPSLIHQMARLPHVLRSLTFPTFAQVARCLQMLGPDDIIESCSKALPDQTFTTKLVRVCLFLRSIALMMSCMSKAFQATYAWLDVVVVMIGQCQVRKTMLSRQDHKPHLALLM